jgi:spermidine synthase
MTPRASDSPPFPAPSRLPPLGRIELPLTVFVSGAVVMLVEILGTRILGPVFGVSLFVWSALLSVTLAALAVGYYVGGRVVDRTPTPRLLGAVVAAGGVLLGGVPWLGRTVLEAVDGLGPRAGPLLGALLLFAPSLTVLGMVGPVAVRLATTELNATGQRVGSIYAVSTAGSLAGTFVTAFLLIPAFETDQILLGSAVLLIVTGAVSLARRGRAVALLGLIVPLLANGVSRPELPAGIQIRARARSPYGLVEVIDDSTRGVRFLRADHSLVGTQFLGDHTSAFGFQHLLEALRFARPRAQELLVIGLGSGSLATALAPHGIRADIVEIDPAVVEFAERYFGFVPEGEVHVEDARTFLRHTERQYDLIVHDTFTGGAAPEHLLSLEVLERVHELLRPNGVLALNFVGYQRGPHVAGSQAVARTLRAVFHTVRSFRDRPIDEKPDAAVNLTFFASDAPLAFTIPADADFENEACAHILHSFQAWEVLKDVPVGPPITDAQNPLARLQLAAAEEHFRDLGELLPLEVWLN